MRRLCLILATVAACAMVARAQPPAGTDPNTPEAKWYRGLTQPNTGYGCCSIADCRSVAFRQVGGHYEALITTATFFPDWSADGGTAPPVQDGWKQVPDAVIIRDRPNPTGEAVACWYADQFRCFVLPSMT